MQLTFASYNIHKAVGLDRIRDPERILVVLREIDADIVALQESDQRFGSRASVIPRAMLDDSPWRALPVARRPQSLGWHGNALLVRRGIECERAEPLELPTLEPRGAAMAEVLVEGRRLRIVGTHLDLSGLRRRDQVRSLMRACSECQPMPTVIMGDFNQWGRSTGAMREFADGWHHLAPGPSYPARRPVARLDRIVATPEWDPIASDVHHSTVSAKASDHLPVWARLKLTR